MVHTTGQGADQWVVNPDKLGLIPIRVPLAYLLYIYGYGGWGCIFVIYFSRISPKDPSLLRFYVIKKIKEEEEEEDKKKCMS